MPFVLHRRIVLSRLPSSLLQGAHFTPPSIEEGHTCPPSDTTMERNCTQGLYVTGRNMPSWSCPHPDLLVKRRLKPPNRPLTSSGVAFLTDAASHAYHDPPSAEAYFLHTPQKRSYEHQLIHGQPRQAGDRGKVDRKQASRCLSAAAQVRKSHFSTPALFPWGHGEAWRRDRRCSRGSSVIRDLAAAATPCLSSMHTRTRACRQSTLFSPGVDGIAACLDLAKPKQSPHSTLLAHTDRVPDKKVMSRLGS
ncbi:uncharacterized protein LY79DRAFT_659162 [Colletotrichum navitas]|uniref:Uncharacterized protein n=1 Tax=Colletotrichum navitas TaxID=681940 RepID=A0AAD8PZY1_9PEZI|nr:uncharacterized protein LY79DRAFT_659162 [Colletotrichum navitas]KAK1593212.1 hypothetical protein LY79DRAFT_659162 [Colletotrichum navitas]